MTKKTFRIVKTREQTRFIDIEVEYDEADRNDPETPKVIPKDIALRLAKDKDFETDFQQDRSNGKHYQADKLHLFDVVEIYLL